MFRLMRRATLGADDRGRGGAVFLSVTLAAYLALGPLRLYMQNSYYYDVDLPVVALSAAGLFVLLALFLAAVLSALGQSARRVTMGALFGLLITLFVFDNILFFIVPELDGSTQAVTSPVLFVLDGVVAGILIALAFATPLFSYRPLMARVLTFVLLFSALQIVLAALSPSTAVPPESAVKRKLAGNLEKVALSPDRNIIHVIFDMFQGTEFEAALEKRGGAEDLQGFVWFKDTIGVHSLTSLSLPSIFTGKIYSEDTMRDYYSGDDRTFLDALAEDHHFEQTLYTALPLPIPNSDRIESHHARRLIDRSPPVAGELGHLLDLFLIRASPFLAKNFFLNDYNFRLRNLIKQRFIGNEVYRRAFADFTNRLAVSTEPSTAPQYYFLHLIYPHPPYSHNEDCTAAGVVMARSYEQGQIEITCALGDFIVLLERLKDLGVYDETMIIMQGDTGGGLGVAELWTSSLPGPIKNGMPFPVLLVKDFGTQGDMTISRKPASIQDVANTITGALGREPEFPGYDLLSAQDLSSRVRQYRGWRTQPNALAAASWSRIPRQEADERPKAEPLKPGDVLSFGGAGYGHLYRRGNGWSTTSVHGTWALYPAADLMLPLDQSAADDIGGLTFRVRLGGELDPEKPIRYVLNGAAPQPIDFAFITERLATFEIPMNEGAPGAEATLSFLFEEPLNDQISDGRPLGFLIETMTVNR